MEVGAHGVRRPRRLGVSGRRSRDSPWSGSQIKDTQIGPRAHGQEGVVRQMSPRGWSGAKATATAGVGRRHHNVVTTPAPIRLPRSLLATHGYVVPQGRVQEGRKPLLDGSGGCRDGGGRGHHGHRGRVVRGGSQVGPLPPDQSHHRPGCLRADLHPMHDGGAGAGLGHLRRPGGGRNPLGHHVSAGLRTGGHGGAQSAPHRREGPQSQRRAERCRRRRRAPEHGTERGHVRRRPPGPDPRRPGATTALRESSGQHARHGRGRARGH